MSIAKHWCFTLNNYNDNDLQRISEGFQSGDFVYIVYGKEVAASGTPHLQGFVSSRKKIRVSGLVRSLGQAHFSVARDVRKSIEYCKKDGLVTEFGSPEDVLSPLCSKGKRTDIESFKDAVKAGMFDLKELREAHSLCLARYPRFCLSYIRDHKPRVDCPSYPLYDWQRDLVEIVVAPPCPRTIYFIVDEEGNKGKSYICTYLEVHHGAQVMKCGKRDDMAFELDENPSVVCIDVSRSMTKCLIYQFLEDLKDGRVFSPKYESYTKRFNSPHVLVFMNETPDMTQLSADRYSIKNI